LRAASFVTRQVWSLELPTTTDWAMPNECAGAAIHIPRTTGAIMAARIARAKRKAFLRRGPL
jgi:hypothetical protein